MTDHDKPMSMVEVTDEIALAALCGWNNVEIGYFKEYNWPSEHTLEAWRRAISAAFKVAAAHSEAKPVELPLTDDSLSASSSHRGPTRISDGLGTVPQQTFPNLDLDDAIIEAARRHEFTFGRAFNEATYCNSARVLAFAHEILQSLSYRAALTESK